MIEEAFSQDADAEELAAKDVAIVETQANGVVWTFPF